MRFDGPGERHHSGRLFELDDDPAEDDELINSASREEEACEALSAELYIGILRFEAGVIGMSVDASSSEGPSTGVKVEDDEPFSLENRMSGAEW